MTNPCSHCKTPVPSKVKVCDACREQLKRERCKTPDCQSQTSGFGTFGVFCQPCYENLRSIAGRHERAAKPAGGQSIPGADGKKKSKKEQLAELVQRVGHFVQSSDKVVISRSELQEHFGVSDSRLDRAVKEAKGAGYIAPAEGYIAGEVKAEAPAPEPAPEPEEKPFDYISDVPTAAATDGNG